MGRFVAAMLLAIVGLSVAADGFCCADGCTRAARPQAASPHEQHGRNDGACVFCQGGAVTPPARMVMPASVVLDTAPTQPTPTPADDSFGAVEHPPRL